MSGDHERKAFEAWAVTAEAFALIPAAEDVTQRLPSGAYLYRSVQQAWEAWKARAAGSPLRVGLTAAQRDRLYDNAPDITLGAKSRAAFHRLVELVEAAHEIHGAKDVAA